MKSKVSSLSDRQIWIDVFKAIAIICVVIGHSTGNLNQFIYQFHMAAFFFIAGFCTNWYKHRKLRLIWDRFCSLIIPLVTMTLLGAVIFSILNMTGSYDLFFDESLPYLGVPMILKNFFLYGHNYVWTLGAAWFVQILFYIVVLHAVLASFFDLRQNSTRVLYLLSTVSIYIIAFYYIQNGSNSNLCRMGMGQLYFGIGCVVRYNQLRDTEKKRNKGYNILTLIVGMVISTLIMYVISLQPNSTVDYPNLKSFSRIILNVVAALNGILWVYFMSKTIEILVDKIRNNRVKTKIKNMIFECGSNTIGIMFLHFAMFKVVVALLATVGIVQWSYLRNFTPSANNIGWKYLWLFVSISIIGSVFVWKVLTKTPILRFFMGVSKESYGKIYNLFEKTKLIKEIYKLKNKYEPLKAIRYFCGSIKHKELSEKITLSALLLLFANMSYIIIRQGLTLNDELQAHNRRLGGFISSIKEGVVTEIGQGRPLRSMAAFNNALSHITTSVYFNRFIQCLVIGITLYVLYKMIVELFSKRIGYLSVLFILIFLPLSFEHGAPNAFNGLTYIPLLELSLAVLLFAKYLKENKKSYLVCSAVIWAISLCGYEFIVTYTPLFLILYLFLNKKRSFMDMVKKCMCHGMIGGIYVVLTFVLQSMSEQAYSGVQMSFSNHTAIIRVIVILVTMGFPGSFLAMPKYQYLIDLYGNNLGENFIMSNIIPVIVIGVVIVLTGIGAIQLLKSTVTNEQSLCFKSRRTIVLFVILIYVILPVLPNSVTTLYQESVTWNWFNWLPVSTFVFITVCLLMAYVSDWVYAKNKKAVLIIVGCVIILIGGMVQYSNKVISDRSSANFERLSFIWKVMDTETMARLDNATIYSNDIFETRELLAEHDGYWNQYLQKKRYNYTVLKAMEGMESVNWLAMPADTYVTLTTTNEAVVFSKYPLKEWIMIEESEGHIFNVQPGNYFLDKGMFIYGYYKKDDAYHPMAQPDNIFLEYSNIAGHTLDTIVKEFGFENDGWVNMNSKFRISVKDKGIISIDVYFPEYINGNDYTMQISIDSNEPMEYKLKDSISNLKIETNPNEEHVVSILTNFKMQNTGADIRELSWIISNAEAE